MRILIVGNSHVGSVARAMAAGPAPPGVDVEFLAAPARQLSGNLRFEGALLTLADRASERLVRPSDMDPAGRLDLLRYDRVVLFGFQLVSGGAGAKWIDVLRNSVEPYSAAVWEAYAVDAVRDTEHWRLVSAITDPLVRARTVSLPCPFPSALSPKFRTVRSVSAPRVRAFLDASAAEMGRLGVAFHPLPDALLDATGHATHPRFKSTTAGDFSHLNEAGGRIVLDFIAGLAPRNLATSVTVE